MGSANIEIYLDNDEHPTDLMMVKRSSTSMVMHVFDREHIDTFMKKMRSESMRDKSISGVYILLSKERAYVGQTNTIDSRIVDHLRDPSKGWWKRAVFVRKNVDAKDGLTKTELNYIESRLIEMCREGMLDTENSQKGNSDRFNDGTMAETEKLVQDAVQFMNVVGIDCIVPRLRQKTLIGPGDYPDPPEKGNGRPTASPRPPEKGGAIKKKAPTNSADDASARKVTAIAHLNENGACCTEDNTRYTTTGRIDIPLTRISKVRYIAQERGGSIKCIELYTQSLGNFKTPRGGLKVYGGKIRLNLDPDFVDSYSGIDLRTLSVQTYTYASSSKPSKKQSK